MQIFIHKTGAMHCLLRYLSAGYIEFISGVVDPDKIIGLSEKFEKLYFTNINKHKRAYRKSKGLGNAHFLCYPSKDQTKFQFFLLLSPGDHPARNSERLSNAKLKRQRLYFDSHYEAIVLPASGDIPRWTWRLTDEKLADVKANLSEIIRVKRNRKSFREYIAVLEKMPSFRGIRKQVKNLRDTSTKEWNRINRENTDITIVPHSGWLRHKKYPMISIDLVIERMKLGKKPMKTSWMYNDDYGGESLISLPKKEIE